jgi:hypothetical protein
MDSAVSLTPAKAPSWVETFAGVLIAPDETFRGLAERAKDRLSGIGGAFATVCFVFALDGLRSTSTSALDWALLNVPSSIIAGLLMWLFLSTGLALLAACFNAPPDRTRALFVTTGWSFAPFALMAPVWCYRSLSGHAFPLLVMLPLVWVVVTQVRAIRETLQLKAWQVLALVFIVPALESAFSGMQMAQAFCVVLSSLFS